MWLLLVVEGEEVVMLAAAAREVLYLDPELYFFFQELTPFK